MFTNAQTTTFFTDPGHMGIAPRTRVKLAEEGLTLVPDLQDFCDTSFTSMMENLKKPGGVIPNPVYEAAVAAIPAPTATNADAVQAANAYADRLPRVVTALAGIEK